MKAARADAGTLYPSKVDLWLAVVLACCPLTFFAIGGGLLFTLEGALAGWLTILGGVLVGMLMGAFIFPCHYRLDDEGVSIRCGVFFKRIALQDITRVFPTNNPLSAPDLSLQRVQIEATGNAYLISPKPRDVFIKDLEQRRRFRAA